MVNSSPVLYKGPERTPTIEELPHFADFKPFGRFLEDYTALSRLLGPKGELLNQEFPSTHPGLKGFVSALDATSMVDLGDGLRIGVKLVPSYSAESGEVTTYGHSGEDFMVETPIMINPLPIQTYASEIKVREMKDGSAVNPPSVERMLQNLDVNLRGLSKVDLYLAVLFVPISSSPDPEEQYVTQFMLHTTSPNGNWYKPVLQGKELTGPIMRTRHTERPIDFSGSDGRGHYWRFEPIDLFGDAQLDIFGSDTGRLDLIIVPEKTVYQKTRIRGDEDVLGGLVDRFQSVSTFRSMSAGFVTAGSGTGRNYQTGDVDIDSARDLKALSILTIGVRPDTEDISLDQIAERLSRIG